jgi:hypothetical protein
MGFLDWLFGTKQEPTQSRKMRFDYLIYDDDEKIEPNKWYQKSSWDNKNFLSYKGLWGPDWKWSDEGKVKVVGLSHGNRSEDFLRIAQEKTFKMYLEAEPDNPVNRNAIKVMASATIDGKSVSKHIGYLPDDIANKYAGVELDIRPESVFLPKSDDLNLGIKVVLLVRSARYLKKKKI